MKLRAYLLHHDLEFLDLLETLLSEFNVEAKVVHSAKELVTISKREPCAVVFTHDAGLGEPAAEIIFEMRKRAHLLEVPVVILRSALDELFVARSFGPHTKTTSLGDARVLARTIANAIPSKVARRAHDVATKSARRERTAQVAGVLRAIERLLEDALQVTDSDVERIGEAFVARIVEHGPTTGPCVFELTVRWLDARMSRFLIAGTTTLPRIDDREDAFELTPQRGLVPRLLSLLGREIELGDDAIDDALLIRAEDRARVVLNDTRASLATLAPHLLVAAQREDAFALEVTDVPRHRLRAVVSASVELFRAAHRARLAPAVS